MSQLRGMVGEISPKDLLVGPRHRKVYNKIEELAKDMQQNGIISPLAVRYARTADASPTGVGDEGYNPEEGKKFWLIAGGRRTKAIQLAGFDIIPVRVYSQALTEMEEVAIEMMENIQREDLTWQEKTEGLARLHALQIAMHGEKTTSSPYDTGWSQKDTAEALGVAPAKVSQDLSLASAMKEVPEIAKCKTADEARKLLNAMVRKAAEEEIVKRHEAKKDSTPEGVQKQRLIQSYISGDTFERLRDVPDASVDFVDLDPPYGIEFDTLFDSDTSANSFQSDNADFKDIKRDEYPSFVGAVLKECHRILRPSGWIVCWHSIWHSESTYLAMKDTGFTCNRGPALWVKPGKVGRNNNPYTLMTLDYEPFLYGHKGMGELREPGRSSIFSCRPCQNKIHPTEKPITLMEDVLEVFSSPGQQVLVPFLGSGNTLLACSNRKRQAFGFDKAKAFRNSFAIRVMRGTLENFIDDEYDFVEENEDAADINS